MELVAESLDGEPPLREGAVDPIGGSVAPHGVLTDGCEALGAQGPPDLHFEARRRGALRASILEDRAEASRTRATLAAEGVEPSTDGRSRGEAAVNGVFDD